MKTYKSKFQFFFVYVVAMGIILFFLQSCSGNKSETTENTSATRNDSVTAKIKQMTQEVFKAVTNGNDISSGEKIYDGSSFFDPDVNCFYQFNEKGLETEKKYFGAKNKLTGHITLEYEAAGKLKKEVILADDFRRDVVPLNAKLKFDDKGNLIEKKFIPAKKMRYQVEYIYHYKYHYDAKGVLQSDWMHEWEADGDVSWKYSYDGNGNLVKKESLSSSNFGSYSQTFIFNSKKEITEKFVESTEDDPETGKTTSTKNNFTYKYEYDVKGNWIKKIEYENQKATKIVVRSLDYY